MDYEQKSQSKEGKSNSEEIELRKRKRKKTIPEVEAWNALMEVEAIEDKSKCSPSGTNNSGAINRGGLL